MNGNNYASKTIPCLSKYLNNDKKMFQLQRKTLSSIPRTKLLLEQPLTNKFLQHKLNLSSLRIRTRKKLLVLMMGSQIC